MTLWTENVPRLVQSETAVLPCIVLLSQASQQEGETIKSQSPQYRQNLPSGVK